ncbi:MAG TPA: ATP-binding cassette domain-containing protein [Ginsengibacter sp.]
MISLNNITRIFNKGKENEVKALQDVSLTINDGEFVIIIGVNGSGKSTLLNIIQGAELPNSGTIKINGTDVTKLPEYKRSRWVARVFQNPNNGTAPDLTILDNFRLAALRSQSKKLIVGLNAAFKQKVQDTIAQLGMGLENKINRPMGSLSGGQRQALTLLMSVMDEGDILLMDEPTAALDPKSSQVVLGLADTLNKEHGKTTVLITHNLKDAHQYGSRLVQIHEGKIMRDLSSAEKNKLSLQDMMLLFM